MSGRLGVTTHSQYAWIGKYGADSAQHQVASDDQAEIRRLQKELKWVTDERDILKKRSIFRQPVRVRYAFIREHGNRWPIRWLYCLLGVPPSGFYARLHRAALQQSASAEF